MTVYLLIFIVLHVHILILTCFFIIQARSECVSATTSPPPIIANNLNLLSNTQTLNEMLGSLTKSNSQREVVPVLPATNQPLISESPDFSKPPPNLLPPPPILPPPPPNQTAATLSLQPTAAQFLTPPPLPPPVPASVGATMTTVATAPLTGFANTSMISPPQQFHHSLPPQQQQHPSIGHQPLLPAQYLTTAPSPIPGPSVSSSYMNMKLPAPLGVQTMGLPAMYVPGLSGLDGLLTPPLQPQSVFNNPGLVYGLPGVVPGLPPIGSMLQIPSTVFPAGLPPAQMTQAAGIPVAPPTPTSSFNLATSTPQAIKRKASIPPSPEDSPGGRPYIGQHSQGLGGHYADSYWYRKRAKYH